MGGKLSNTLSFFPQVRCQDTMQSTVQWLLFDCQHFFVAVKLGVVVRRGRD